LHPSCLGLGANNSASCYVSGSAGANLPGLKAAPAHGSWALAERLGPPGGRFFMVAVLLNRYGDTIRASIEKRLGLWVALGAIILVLGFVIAFRMV
jgi:hypothetical protein